MAAPKIPYEVERSISRVFFTSPRRPSQTDQAPESSQLCDEVKTILEKSNKIYPTRVKEEVEWFFWKLGLDESYFRRTPAEIIATHIVSLYAAKIVAHTNGTHLQLNLSSEQGGKAIFITHSSIDTLDDSAVALHNRMEQEFLGEGYENYENEAKKKRYRVQCYRTTGSVSTISPVHLRFFFLSQPNYVNPQPTGEVKLDQVACADLLSALKDHPKTYKLYQEMLEEVEKKGLGACFRFHEANQKGEVRLTVGYKHGSTHSFFSGIMILYDYHNLFCTIKFVEQFSNNTTIHSIYLKQKNQNATQFNPLLKDRLLEDANLLYVLPRTSLTPLFLNQTLTVQEVTYAYCAWKFVYQFTGRFSAEYAEFTKALSKDPAKLNLLIRLRNRLRKDTFTESRVKEAIFEHSSLIKVLYKDFSEFHSPLKDGKSEKVYDPEHGEEILSTILKTVESELDAMIFTTFLLFNRSILKTNFYKTEKVALAFRLNPAFLQTKNYDYIPFAVIFIIGSEFRGYHVRFRDIARGGVRIIRSHNAEAFSQNASSLFDENYNLALTQLRKNKDIPEGGSKGTILLSIDHQDKASLAFRKYVDALLDMMMPDSSIVDHYGKEELLFLGPDEGTADFMNWASEHAQHRGYKFWRSFTTGKSREKGGIPHDMYGMTTRSIHQYVLGILEKKGLKEEDVTKLQTGGPDGDLGSNEIKISFDKTKAVIDGSGVLYDPNGLNRAELVRLAENRVMARNFDRSKLSPKGFFVDVQAIDVTLPNGTNVESGLQFRNEFHLHPLFSADIFVPCGGRPEAVHNGNVHLLFDEKTKRPHFAYVVEGANLFFSQGARLFLEKEGVVIFKDASANKGGVTSSSLEVLAALALNDEEFHELMCVKDRQVPEFYAEYVAEVQEIIAVNARAEFNCIWNEHEKTGTYRSLLSDQLSERILTLKDNIMANSSLWNNLTLRNCVLSKAIPAKLITRIGLEKITQRVPESYLKAVFASYLASRYIYQFGLCTPEFSFFVFVKRLVDLA